MKGQLDERGFVFLDSLKRPFLCRMIKGTPWLCYWNEGGKCFTTLRPVTQMEIFQFPHNLTEREQEMYLDYHKFVRDNATEDEE